MNVLAVRQDNNGDVLLMGPALRALAAGAKTLTLVCGPSGRSAAETLPGIDRIVCFEAGWIEANPSAIARDAVSAFVDRIAESRIDRAVIFTSFHQSPLPMALLLRLAGVPWIAAISEDYPGSLLTVRHRNVPDRIHEVERALSLANAAGFALPPHDEGRLSMNVAPVNPISDMGRYIVVHPGATVPARAWSPASNRDLVRALAACGKRVVVTGSESERSLCAFVAGEDAVSLAGRTSFATAARVIADADAIVVGNTGAAHIAAAVGTPTISIFAPTVPSECFRPWMVEQILLGDQTIECAGCRARECPRLDQACVSGITVDEVVSAIRRLERREAMSDARF
jgi:ADP-heptose:LPS heptosyltransferase